MADDLAPPGAAWREAFGAAQLLRLAGERSYHRGAGYHDDGRVRRLERSSDAVAAVVDGTSSYRVRLRVDAGEPTYACSCPVGDTGAFCKHAVAVALAVVTADAAAAASADPPAEDAMRTYLESLDRGDLVALLLERALVDDALNRQLTMRAASRAASGDGAGVDPGAYHRAIDAALEVLDFVPYRDTYDYLTGVAEVVDGLADRLAEGHAAAVIALCEYALEALERAWPLIDDSGGGVGEERDRLVDLHHDACLRAQPDPTALAERLFDWELRSEYETFLGAAERYADVLGHDGLAAYRQLVQNAWAEVPALEPGEQRAYGSSRFRITYAMQSLARASGDVDELVGVLARDLSSAYQFVRIAEVLRDAERHDEALAWAERGLAAFPERTDARLRTVVADGYHRLGHHDEAMDLVWTTFAERHDLASYQALRTHAQRAGTWQAWRERALTSLRRRAAAPNGARRSVWARGEGSVLVQVLLWERDPEGAWAAAHTCGCTPDLWLELARQREEHHPCDALPIYRDQVEHAIAGTNERAYAEGVAWMKRVQELMARLGEAERFAAYAAEVRARHRRKRNLIKLFDQEGW